MVFELRCELERLSMHTLRLFVIGNTREQTSIGNAALIPESVLKQPKDQKSYCRHLTEYVFLLLWLFQALIEVSDALIIIQDRWFHLARLFRTSGF